MKAGLSWNVKLPKAKQETSVCSANHFLLRAVYGTWSMKGSLFSLQQIEVIRGEKQHQSRGLHGRALGHQVPELLRKGRPWCPACLCWREVFESYLFNRMNVKATGRKKKQKAAQNCHLSAASCPCLSSSLLTVILRPSWLQRFPLFYFWEQNMDLDLHYPSPRLIRAPKRVRLLFSVRDQFSSFSAPPNDF